MNPSRSLSPEAEACYRVGDYTGAAALLGLLVREDPPPLTGLRMLGLCRLRLGAPFEALVPVSLHSIERAVIV